MAINKSNIWRTKRSMDAQKAQFPTKDWNFHVHKYPLDLESNVELSHYVAFYISLPAHRLENDVNTTGKTQEASSDAYRSVRNYMQLTGNRLSDNTSNLGEYLAKEQLVEAADRADVSFNRWVEQQALLDRGVTEIINRTTTIDMLADKAKAAALGIFEGAANAQMKMTHEAIMLYFPEALSTGYELDWQADSMRTSAILGKTVNDAIKVGGGQGFSMEGLSKAVMGGVMNMGLSTIFGDILSVTTKAVQNPYMEMLFRGVQNRSLELSFKFTPRSEKEAQEVHRIITTFKRHGLPKVAGEGVIGRNFYAYPAEWDIIFYTVPKESSKETHAGNVIPGGPKFWTFEQNVAGDKAVQNRYISRYGRSVLESINVNYTPAGPSFHHPDQDKAGAAPVETDLTLRFKEIDLVTADLVENEGLGF